MCQVGTWSDVGLVCAFPTANIGRISLRMFVAVAENYEGGNLDQATVTQAVQFTSITSPSNDLTIGSGALRFQWRPLGGNTYALQGTPVSGMGATLFSLSGLFIVSATSF